MTVALWLGPVRPRIGAALRASGLDVVRAEDKLTGDDPRVQGATYLVSYGYRYILRRDVLDRFPGRAVNLHISYLPFNRGSDPNLWSFLEDSPKGVTIHLLDEGVDTGMILRQREVAMQPDDTLATSYARLSTAIEDLFEAMWPAFVAGEVPPTPQVGAGSVHRLKDKEPYAHLLTKSWDTPVSQLVGRAKAR